MNTCAYDRCFWITEELLKNYISILSNQPSYNAKDTECAHEPLAIAPNYSPKMDLPVSATA
jgi:hypothetical protein